MLMKTLKISLIATLASILAWRMRVPQKFWPAHPQLGGLLLAAILCIALELVWFDREPVTKKSLEPEN